MTRYDRLMGFRFPETVQRLTARDTILYALGVGAGDEPDDPWELRHVYEDGLVALPTMAVVLAYPGNWYRTLPVGLNDTLVVHASEHFKIHRPLPTAGTLVATPRIAAIYDKGEGRGSLVVSERVIRDQASGEPVATVTQTAFCRGDGGLGGPVVPSPKPQPVPGRDPDMTVDMPTSQRSALIYRLSGDDNPLHVDPAFARNAGFPKPILHGLATYGHIGRAILKTLCGTGPASIREMDCRFMAPVFPGDKLSVALWHDDEVVRFRASVGERVVVDNGFAILA